MTTMTQNKKRELITETSACWNEFVDIVFYLAIFSVAGYIMMKFLHWDLKTFRPVPAVVLMVISFILSALGRMDDGDEVEESGGQVFAFSFGLAILASALGDFLPAGNIRTAISALMTAIIPCVISWPLLTRHHPQKTVFKVLQGRRLSNVALFVMAFLMDNIILGIIVSVILLIIQDEGWRAGKKLPETKRQSLATWSSVVLATALVTMFCEMGILVPQQSIGLCAGLIAGIYIGLQAPSIPVVQILLGTGVSSFCGLFLSYL